MRRLRLARNEDIYKCLNERDFALICSSYPPVAGPWLTFERRSCALRKRDSRLRRRGSRLLNFFGSELLVPATCTARHISSWFFAFFCNRIPDVSKLPWDAVLILLLLVAILHIGKNSFQEQHLRKKAGYDVMLSGCWYDAILCCILSNTIKPKPSKCSSAATTS